VGLRTGLDAVEEERLAPCGVRTPDYTIAAVPGVRKLGVAHAGKFMFVLPWF
jgi:hypothetical protein